MNGRRVGLGRDHRKDRPVGSREQYRRVSVGGVLKGKGCSVIIDPVASDLVSFSESFLREHIRGFHDLQRQKFLL
jgi:hypothetical protein